MKLINEQLLHQTVAVFLARALPPGSWTTAIDHSGKQSYITAAKLKARGAQKGVPDHLVLIPGFAAIFMEIKKPDGRVSPEQYNVARCIEFTGHHWFCVRSVEDAENALLGLNVPLRATVSGIRASIAAQNEGLRPVRRRAASGKRMERATPAQVAKARRVGMLV